MPVVLEDWIGQSSNLKNQCEKIRGAAISSRTWRDWERLAGAVYPQGKKVSERSYTPEQTELLLCLAWYRKCYPRVKVTYSLLRDYWQSNEYKLDEVFDAFCEAVNSPQEKQPQKPAPKLIALSSVKKSCDQIMNRCISRNCWASWKQFLGIPKYERYVEEGLASILVYMACWRHDNPTRKFPSVNRLITMMKHWSRRAMTLETNSSGKMYYRWQIRGCLGKDLAKYLAAYGYKVSTRTLYKWGHFSQRRHYSPSELWEWKNIAAKKRCA
jgi:DNA-binding transcriptional MerR regulator